MMGGSPPKAKPMVDARESPVTGHIREAPVRGHRPLADPSINSRAYGHPGSPMNQCLSSGWRRP